MAYIMLPNHRIGRAVIYTVFVETMASSFKGFEIFFGVVVAGGDRNSEDYFITV